MTLSFMKNVTLSYLFRILGTTIQPISAIGIGIQSVAQECQQSVDALALARFTRGWFWCCLGPLSSSSYGGGARLLGRTGYRHVFLDPGQVGLGAVDNLELGWWRVAKVVSRHAATKTGLAQRLDVQYRVAVHCYPLSHAYSRACFYYIILNKSVLLCECVMR